MFTYQIKNKVMVGEGDIEKGEVNASVPVLEPRPVEQWERALLRHDSPMLSTCCIFRVPEVLRRQDILAYEPDIVSIGPFHRGVKKQFQFMENVKKWYLTCVLESLNKSMESLIDSVIKDLEIPAIRGCYADTLDLDQNSFVEMLILDGCFLVEFFRKAPYPERQDEHDPIFNVPCTLEYIYHDLLLLENQLPWSVLEFFYRLIEKGTPEKDLSVVVVDFFRRSVVYPSIFSYRKAESLGSHPIFHILDLIRTSLIQDLEVPSVPSATAPPAIVDVHLPQSIPSASSLSEAGVTFKKGVKKEGEPGCILNIKFDKKAGVFTIPQLAIDERTGPMFRNLMAFEQCYHSCKHLITSYAVLMDNLIDTNKDVNFLCEEGIVANWLSAEVASKFFNNLYKDTTVVNYHYKELCDDVHEYHNNTWNRWREKLKRDYFDTPWSTISFFAAFVLLVLTFLQTIYTVQPYYHPHG